jgi:hypothetical protein
MDKIQVLHASFIDFIFDQKHSGKYHLSKSQCHVVMANCCEEYAQAHKASYDDAIIHHSIYPYDWTLKYSVDAWHQHCIHAKPEEMIPLIIS